MLQETTTTDAMRKEIELLYAGKHCGEVYAA